MKQYIEAAIRCEIGKVRENNEDNFYFGGKILREKNKGLRRTRQKRFSLDGTYLAVFDGMGGHQCGEKASYLAAKTVRKALKENKKPKEKLLAMCNAMNDEICRTMKELFCGRMGSTLVSVLFEEEKAYICNLGDSRAFLLRDGTLEQVTEDHTDEKINKILGIKRRPRLTQHLGVYDEELELDPFIKEIELREQDRYLLCSDGLTDMLTEEEICEIMLAEKDTAKCVDKLMEQAMEHGGRDNTTVLVCDVCL